MFADSHRQLVLQLGKVHINHKQFMPCNICFPLHLAASLSNQIEGLLLRLHWLKLSGIYSKGWKLNSDGCEQD